MQIELYCNLASEARKYSIIALFVFAAKPLAISIRETAQLRRLPVLI